MDDGTVTRRAPRWGGRIAAVALLLLAAALTACETMLPETEELTHSPWPTYQAAKAAYDEIVPGATTADDLKARGFDPGTTANVADLSYLDVMQRFMADKSVRVEDLEAGVRACLEARSACRGYEINPKVLHSERKGNVLADIFGFRRHTVRTGWRFWALVLLQDGLVIYKIWRGEPSIHEEQHETNPLGPLQDVSGIARDAATP